MKRTTDRVRGLLVGIMLLATLAGGRPVLAAPAGSVVAQDDSEALIANAESAAPTVIGQEATIMGWDEDGMPTVVLREGTNGWTCLPDWPATPGNDPQCLDAVFNAWNDAF